MKQNEADLEILEVLIAESEAVNEGKDKQKKTNNSPEEEKNENDGDGDADSDADSVDMEAMRQGAEALTNNITMLSDIIANTKKEIAAAKAEAERIRVAKEKRDNIPPGERRLRWAHYVAGWW